MGSEDPLARHKDTLALAAEILVDLELNRFPLANIAMKCARLARFTGDDRAHRWFLLEVGGYSENADKDWFEIALGAGRCSAETRDKPQAETAVWTDSIAAMESTVETSREQLKHLDVPPMTEGSARQMFYIPGSSLKEIVQTFLGRQNAISSQITSQVRILAEIRKSIYMWALERYHLLRFVDIPADAFERAKALVDDRLAAISPDALQMFAAAQDRARSASSEEWSQATASLRRIMKEVADRLYPATDLVVDDHALGEEQYVNRLWQFVRERATGDRQDMLAAQVQYLGQRIDVLYEFACKGTHHKITQADIELAVVHLYLLLADLLSMLAPEELAALTAPRPQAAAPSA